MEIREIVNRNEWEDFFMRCGEKTFLQSWDWGEFNLKMGSKIWRFGAFNNGRMIGVSLVIKISARRGTFLFIPHGPVVIDGMAIKDKKEILELVLEHLNGIAKEEKACFIRVSPIFLDTEENRNIFLDIGFRQAPIHMHPEVTWELLISPPEDQLIMEMRKTTRYLIKQAAKNPDIKIEVSSNIEDLKLFWPVYRDTAKRHNFVVFSEKYLESEFNSFVKDREILIFLGKYKEKVVSAALFVFWQDMSFYHHSGSLSKYNKIPVSYLLQWRAIQEAKNKGCRIHNFWGIAPGIENETDAQKSSHPWGGLSLFKMGFGGYKKEYVKTQDYIITNRYWLNYFIETLRKRKRNL